MAEQAQQGQERFEAQQAEIRGKKSVLAGGGIAGILTAAAIGGSEDFREGYTVGRDLLAKEEQNKAKLLNQYADLELKSREISFANMELEVVQQEQSGRIDNAKRFAERAKNAWANIDIYKNIDRNELAAKAIASQMKMDDQSRQVLSQGMEQVNDEASYQRLYNQMEQVAQQADMPVDELFPGVKKEWEGKRTKDLLRGARNSLAASQKTIEAERLGNFEHDLNMDMQEMLADDRAIHQYRKFVYDSLLQRDLMSMRLQVEKVKSKGVDVERSDFESMNPNQIASNLTSRITGISKRYAYDPNKVDEELAAFMREAADNISVEFDEAWFDFKAGRRPEPKYQGDLIDKYENILVSRMGVDGKIYSPNSQELRKQRQNFMDGFIEQSKKDPVDGPAFRSMSLEEQQAWALRAWGNKNYRMENDQQ